MKKQTYRREHPDGSVEFFSDAPQKPLQLYYDDILQNRDRSDELPLQLTHFGKEQSYPRRTIRDRRSDFFILHYVTGGKGKFNGVPIRAGEGFVTFPTLLHTLEADPGDPWHFCWLSFRGRDAHDILRYVGILPEKAIFRYDFSEQMESIFEEMLYRAHTDADLNCYLVAKFYELMAYHRREYLEMECEEDGQAGYAQRAMAYIDGHYAEDLRIEQLASELHVSRKYLCRVFHAHWGMSPKEYLLQKRIAEAMRLLGETDASIPDVARQVGYEDYTQLTRLFKNKRGISPLQYRQRKRKE